jgi:WhiB family redox-sensing transcriptional regulator
MSILAQSLALGSADYSWRVNANCRAIDPDMFFPIGNTGEAMRMLVRARAVCADCGVRKECLDFALATNQDCGVWGGTSEEERRDMRRRAAAARRASIA